MGQEKPVSFHQSLEQQLDQLLRLDLQDLKRGIQLLLEQPIISTDEEVNKSLVKELKNLVAEVDRLIKQDRLALKNVDARLAAGLLALKQRADQLLRQDLNALNERLKQVIAKIPKEKRPFIQRYPVTQKQQNSLTAKLEKFIGEDLSDAYLDGKIKFIKRHVEVQLWVVLSDLRITKPAPEDAIVRSAEYANMHAVIDFLRIIESGRTAAKRDEYFEVYVVNLLAKIAPNLLAHIKRTKAEDLSGQTRLKVIEAKELGIEEEKTAVREVVTAQLNEFFDDFSPDEPKKNTLYKDLTAEEKERLKPLPELADSQKRGMVMLVSSEIKAVNATLEKDFLTALKAEDAEAQKAAAEQVAQDEAAKKAAGEAAAKKGAQKSAGGFLSSWRKLWGNTKQERSDSKKRGRGKQEEQQNPAETPGALFDGRNGNKKQRAKKNVSPGQSKAPALAS
jgi:hypothetical protein